MKDFFELRESAISKRYGKNDSGDKFVVKYAKSKSGPMQTASFNLLVYAKKFLDDKKKEGYKGIISKGGKPVKESVELDEAVSKVKTTMPDKVASSATRFGLKSKAQGGHVSISGPKGKLNDFLRAIIGRSSYGNASELSESVEEAYRKPTQAEIDADRRKDGKGKDTSSRYKNIKKKMYGNAMGGLKKEESVVDEAKLSDMGIHNKIADRNLLIKAIKTAEKMGGNMTGAVREIEKMKKGLSKHKAVQAALRQANESVELGEAVDFMKMSKELLKHKSKGIEYEKAAAYIRVIHNNSAVSVQDKAFMALTKMLKDMDDLVKKTTITKILKDNGFKVKGGSLMREEVEPIAENYRTLATHGMGTETKNSINVGRDVDYYEPKNGDKRMGKITKMTRSGYVVKDEKDGKPHAFAFYDRAKAKEIMAKSK